MPLRQIQNQTTSLKENGVEGIVTSHSDIIVSLLGHKSLSMSELAALIQKDPSTVTSLIRKLQKLGLVELKKDIDDKRSVRAFLTQEGLALRPLFMQISKDLRLRMYKDIDEEQKPCLSKCSTK